MRVNNNFKKLVSWVVGVPSALAMFSEIESLDNWFVPFVAAGLLLTILVWNGIFRQERTFNGR